MVPDAQYHSIAFSAWEAEWLINLQGKGKGDSLHPPLCNRIFHLESFLVKGNSIFIEIIFMNS